MSRRKASQKQELERIQGRLSKVKNRRDSFDDDSEVAPLGATEAPPAPPQTGEGGGGNAWESINLASPKGKKKGVSPKTAIRKGSMSSGSSRMVWEGSPTGTSKKKTQRPGFNKAPSSRRIVGEDQRFNLMDAENPVISPVLSSPHSSRGGSMAGLFRPDIGGRATGIVPPFADEYNDADAANADSEEYLDSSRHKTRNRLSPAMASVMGCCSDCFAAAKYQFDRLYLSMLRRRGSTNPKHVFGGIVLLILVAGAIAAAVVFVGHTGSGIIRSKEIQKVIVEAGVTSQEVFDSTKKSSPQNQALRWIAKVDPAKLPADHHALLDRYILAVFYYSSNTDGWTNSDKWMTEAGHCSWYGIKCVAKDDENEDGGITKTYDSSDSITEIVLSKNGLEGAIPAELGKLPTLEALDLSENEIGGDLPEFNGNLRYLLLHKNAFQGSFPETVTKMTNLHGIDFSTNGFQGKLPKKLGDLTALRYLMLSANELSGSFPDIEKMYSITKLHLDDNSFTGTLPSFIREFGHLQSLRLDTNKFSGPFPKESIERLSVLEVLSMGGNQLTGTIPGIFDFIHRLVHLHLNNNKFRGTIPSNVGHLSGLTTFRLDYNELTGTIPATFSMMADVEYIALNDNLLTGSIPTSLGYVDDVKYLSLKNNTLTGTIPTEFGTLFRLSDLQLQENNLSGQIPTELGKLETLNKLLLQQNGFSSVTMPPEICALVKKGEMTMLTSDCNIPDKVTCDCCQVCYPLAR